MAHGIGGPEDGTVSANGEFVFPKFWVAPTSSSWNWLIPRLHTGVMGNLGHKTSYAYLGGLWTYDLTDRLFVEGFLGGAIHDGLLAGGPGRAALGCRLAYHLGGSLGYRVDSRWSVMVTFDHISNGRGTFSDCSRNQSLNELGLRIGYSF